MPSLSFASTRLSIRAMLAHSRSEIIMHVSNEILLRISLSLMRQALLEIIMQLYALCVIVYVSWPDIGPRRGHSTEHMRGAPKRTTTDDPSPPVACWPTGRGQHPLERDAPENLCKLRLTAAPPSGVLWI